MAIFHSYVCLPEGMGFLWDVYGGKSCEDDGKTMGQPIMGRSRKKSVINGGFIEQRQVLLLEE